MPRGKVPSNEKLGSLKTIEIPVRERQTVYRLNRIIILVLLAAICCDVPNATGHPNKITKALKNSKLDLRAQKPAWNGPWLSELDLTDQREITLTQIKEPFGVQAIATQAKEVSAKWTDLQSRILVDEQTLMRCHSGEGACSLAVRRLLALIELGRRRQGRAFFGAVNRAVNLSIRPVSDWKQYGLEDYWAAPFTTLGSGAGDCEDYAIVKYFALRMSGISADSLRLVIVRDIRRRTKHAVVTVRHNNEWLILDNRTFVMVKIHDARDYWPLFVLDEQGIKTSATAFVSR
jgi:predicted transglutaminase-like cysteine proteinase